MAGLTKVSWIVSAGAVVALTAVLLVFQYGQPRIFMAMARDGLLPQWAAKIHPTIPHAGDEHHRDRRHRRARRAVADENEIYDLTNIGTLAAFAIVCLGVLVLRIREPERPRPFRVPMVGAVALLGASACVYMMKGLPLHAWERFGDVAGDRLGPLLHLWRAPQPAAARSGRRFSRRNGADWGVTLRPAGTSSAARGEMQGAIEWIHGHLLATHDRDVGRARAAPGRAGGSPGQAGCRRAPPAPVAARRSVPPG